MKSLYMYIYIVSYHIAIGSSLHHHFHPDLLTPEAPLQEDSRPRWLRDEDAAAMLGEEAGFSHGQNFRIIHQLR